MQNRFGRSAEEVRTAKCGSSAEEARKENTQCVLYSDPGQRVLARSLRAFVFYLVLRDFLISHFARFLLRSATTFFYRDFYAFFFNAFFSFLGRKCGSASEEVRRKCGTASEEVRRKCISATFPKDATNRFCPRA